MNPGNPIVALSEFLRSPAGRYVLDWEQAHIDAAVVDIFGYHALQLGLPEIDALRENRMPLRFCAADRQYVEPGAPHADTADGFADAVAAEATPPRRRVAVIQRYEELPFATHSIDLVVMPHILEFAHDPHQVLREVERVLVPEGHVVITGFNPASLWGVRQFGTRLGAAPFLPREGHFIALPRVKDWLKLLSFELARGRYGCYAPSVRTAAWLQRWRFIEKAGDRWWPVLGAVYLITAVKRVRGMRLVGKVWKRAEERAPRLATIGSSRVAVTADAASAVVLDDEPAANEAAPRALRR
jgi:SAM-dependent methyltransferase